MKGVHAKRKGILAISELFTCVYLRLTLQLLSFPPFPPLSLPLSLLLSADTLKELCVSELLPENRKLKSLKQRPLDRLLLSSPTSKSSQSSLLLWYFEDQIKSRYLQFVNTLQVHTCTYTFLCHSGSMVTVSS